MISQILSYLKRKRYKRYLQSDTWKKKRRYVLERDGFKCFLCDSTERLEAHHLFYPKKLGTEKIYSLITLCKRCHTKIHKKLKKIV